MELDANVPSGGSVVGTSVGGDFDDGAAAFSEPNVNGGGSEAGSVAPVKREISYKEVEEDDGEDEDEGSSKPLVRLILKYLLEHSRPS